MKITIVCDVLGAANNGTSIAAYNLINFMLKQGHNVNVVCPDKDRRGEKGFFVVPTVDFGIFNGYVEHNGVVISKRDDIVLMRAIRDRDIVHIMMPFGLGKRSAFICKKYHIPVTAGFHVQAENVTSHFFVQNVKLANWAVYRYFFKHVYSYLDAIHYPTSFIRDVFEKNIGFTTNAYIISNGVSSDFCPKKVERPDFLKNRILILFSGRYAKEKAHPVLIRAIKYSKYKDRIQLIFAGKGPQEKFLRKLARSEKLNYQPIFQLFDHNEMVNTIRLCDLYVHPANVELEGISCLEAIAGGLVPIVSDSDRAATKNFAVDEHNVFKANDSKDLAEKIDYWIDNPDKLKETKLKYLDFGKKYDRKYCMLQMEKMFLEVIERAKKSDGKK